MTKKIFTIVSWMVMVLIVCSNVSAQITEAAKLQASDKEREDYFGNSVSIDGNRAVIGAWEEDTGGDNAGAAYIFERDDNGVWTEVARLQAHDKESDDYFGNSVSISGDRVIVGAVFEDTGSSDAGAAYIFERDSNGVWTEVAKIQAHDKDVRNYFGKSVSINGDRAIVGAAWENTGGTYAGAVYIFERDSSGLWTEVTKLQAHDKDARDEFGISVSSDGDLIIIGAWEEDTGGQNAGAAYIFERASSGEWIEVTKLQASDKDTRDYFGGSVSISGDRIIVGAAFEDTGGDKAGAAYIFERDSNGVWNEVTKLQASDKDTRDYFGNSVSISGNKAIVGAPEEDTGGVNAGAAYIFERDSSGLWTEVTKLQASDKDARDYFGGSVSISGNAAIAGATLEDTGGDDVGAAYIFEIQGGVTQEGVKEVPQLIDAINSANQDPDCDTIDLSATSFTLTDCYPPAPFPGECDSGNGLPEITSCITIRSLVNSGSTIERSSEANIPTFHIFSVNSTGTLTLDHITIAGGSSSQAGGIINAGTVTLMNSRVERNYATSFGGGILNHVGGHLTLISTTITENASEAGAGGIENFGNAFLINSTVSFNRGEGKGGGISNDEGTLELINSTVSRNWCGDQGGGMYNSGIVNLSNSTVSENEADSGGGGIYNDADITVKNTIVANNPSGDNCFLNGGVFQALGTNIDTDGTCQGFIKVTSEELKLEPLAQNGGPTMTQALLQDSVAIDAAADCTLIDGMTLINEDQRGVIRPIGEFCDVGAYEASLYNKIDNKNAKLRFFYSGTIGEDNLLISGYLKEKLAIMPFGEDVTVTVEVPDPQQSANRLNIFTQTIPNNVVSGTKKYRFRRRDPGIQELLFDQRTDSTYFSVKVDEVDFLPNLRAAMSSEEYLELIRLIESYTITITIGENVWSGTALLKIGKFTKAKQELNFQR
jgi:hypothetical protein